MSAYAVSSQKASLIGRIRARAPTYWRYLREEPSWILMFLFARTLAGRRIERRLHGASYRQPLATSDSVMENVDLNKTVRELVEDGMAPGLKLPDAVVADIVEFAKSTPCFARDSQDNGFLPRDVATVNAKRARDIIAAHYFEAVEKSPAISRLTKDTAFINIARAYIGAEPILIRTRMWWSFPAARVSDADLHAAAQERFHFDMNGWRTLKFFFYLTSTSERDGAHRCILGSHTRRPMKYQFTPTLGRATEELEESFGKERFVTITGEAGSGFAEDPFLFHTGSLCQDRPRLILEIEYGASQVSQSYRYGRLG
jgi:hypothetical protein